MSVKYSCTENHTQADSFFIILKDVFIRYLEVIRFVRSSIAVAGHEEGFGSSGSRGTTSDSTLVSGRRFDVDLSGFIDRKSVV